jgi:hypothetical protein
MPRKIKFLNLATRVSPVRGMNAAMGPGTLSIIYGIHAEGGAEVREVMHIIQYY